MTCVICILKGKLWLGIGSIILVLFVAANVISWHQDPPASKRSLSRLQIYTVSGFAVEPRSIVVCGQVTAGILFKTPPLPPMRAPRQRRLRYMAPHKTLGEGRIRRGGHDKKDQRSAV